MQSFFEQLLSIGISLFCITTGIGKAAWVFVVLFIALLPFGLMNEMDKAGEYGVWLTIPFSMLISWVFYTMEQIGEFSENPFDNAINDVPLSAICITIETDVKKFLGDDNIPQKAAPVDEVLL